MDSTTSISNMFRNHSLPRPFPVEVINPMSTSICSLRSGKTNRSHIHLDCECDQSHKLEEEVYRNKYYIPVSRSNSFTFIRPDPNISLNQVVEQFEEVLAQDQLKARNKHRSRQSSICSNTDVTNLISNFHDSLRAYKLNPQKETSPTKSTPTSTPNRSYGSPQRTNSLNRHDSPIYKTMQYSLPREDPRFFAPVGRSDDPKPHPSLSHIPLDSPPETPPFSVNYSSLDHGNRTKRESSSAEPSSNGTHTTITTTSIPINPTSSSSSSPTTNEAPQMYPVQTTSSSSSISSEGREGNLRAFALLRQNISTRNLHQKQPPTLPPPPPHPTPTLPDVATGSPVTSTSSSHSHRRNQDRPSNPSSEWKKRDTTTGSNGSCVTTSETLLIPGSRHSMDPKVSLVCTPLRERESVDDRIIGTWSEGHRSERRRYERATSCQPELMPAVKSADPDKKKGNHHERDREKEIGLKFVEKSKSMITGESNVTNRLEREGKQPELERGECTKSMGDSVPVQQPDHHHHPLSPEPITVVNRKQQTTPTITTTVQSLLVIQPEQQTGNINTFTGSGESGAGNIHPLPQPKQDTSNRLQRSGTYNLQVLTSNEMVSTGTDPLPPPSLNHVTVQVKPTCINRGTRMDLPPAIHSVGIQVMPDKGIDSSTQTLGPVCEKKKLLVNSSTQVNFHCPECSRVKQTETVGVGEGSVHMVEVSCGSDEQMKRSESGSLIKLPPIPPKTPESVRKSLIPSSPTLGSRIPRYSPSGERATSLSPSRAAPPSTLTLIPDSSQDLSTSEGKSCATSSGSESKEPINLQSNPPSPSASVPSTSSTYNLAASGSSSSCKSERSGDIVIEEGANEILVFRKPTAVSLNPPGTGKHRTLLPQMIAEESKQMSTACRLKDFTSSDEEDTEESEEEPVTVKFPEPKQQRIRVEPSKEMKAALKVLNDSLQKGGSLSQTPATKKSLQIIEGEWFKISSTKEADPFLIEDYLDHMEGMSKHLLNHVVNITDCNGNTAMHYSVSHSNFDVVSVLLDSKVCDVNKLNKAGYTSLMLVSLAKIGNDTQKAVIRRLFQLGDVNLRAKSNGQTALMLAASHGQFATCKLLLESGAGVNVQDKDGSTALMCAAEHAHIDVVRLILSHPDTDSTMKDHDGSTALSIAMSTHQKDIGLLIYASMNNLTRGCSPHTSLTRRSIGMYSNSVGPNELRRTTSWTNQPSEPRSLKLPPSPPKSPKSQIKSRLNSSNKKIPSTTST